MRSAPDRRTGTRKVGNEENALFLAIAPPLAYSNARQPITRADLEAIRGVQSSEVLRQLMEKGLVRIAGRDDSLGRPVLYGTTKKFLQVFGLKSLRDLPMNEQLKLPDRTEPEVSDERSEA